MTDDFLYILELMNKLQYSLRYLISFVSPSVSMPSLKVEDGSPSVPSIGLTWHEHSTSSENTGMMEDNPPPTTESIHQEELEHR